MKKRTARRLALMRHARWLIRHHPMSTAPECLIREHNRLARRYNKRQWSKDMPSTERRNR